MRARIEQVVGPEARNIWMGTFHSVFARILRIEAEKLGYTRDFTIYDTDDSKSLIKQIIKERNLDEKNYKPSIVLNRISAAKNKLIQAALYAQNAELLNYDEVSGRPKMHELYTAYSERCFRSGAMDFDDLLLNTYKLLQNFPEALHKYQHPIQICIGG